MLTNYALFVTEPLGVEESKRFEEVLKPYSNHPGGKIGTAWFEA